MHNKKNCKDDNKYYASGLAGVVLLERSELLLLIRRRGHNSVKFIVSKCKERAREAYLRHGGAYVLYTYAAA